MNTTYMAAFQCYRCDETTLSMCDRGETPTTLCPGCDHTPQLDGNPIGRLTCHCVDCGAEYYLSSDVELDGEEVYLGAIRCTECNVVFRDEDDE